MRCGTLIFIHSSGVYGCVCVCGVWGGGVARCLLAISAWGHICTILVFINVRRFGMSDYVVSSRIIMMNWNGFGRRWSWTKLAPPRWLSGVCEEEHGKPRAGGYTGRVSNWVLSGVCWWARPVDGICSGRTWCADIDLAQPCADTARAKWFADVAWAKCFVHVSCATRSVGVAWANRYENLSCASWSADEAWVKRCTYIACVNGALQDQFSSTITATSCVAASCL
jgi:hypothetical protein